MTHPVLRPHEQQDGYAYVRVAKAAVFDNDPDHPRWLLKNRTTGERYPIPAFIAVACQDNRPDSRIISSRRVERDVEQGDYLRLCKEENLIAIQFTNGSWRVGHPMPRGTACAASEMLNDTAHAKTLRRAYLKYHKGEFS